MCRRRKSQRKEKTPEVTKVTVDVPSHPSDPVEMRRLNFQTPGKDVSSVVDN